MVPLREPGTRIEGQCGLPAHAGRGETSVAVAIVSDDVRGKTAMKTGPEEHYWITME